MIAEAVDNASARRNQVLDVKESLSDLSDEEEKSITGGSIKPIIFGYLINQGQENIMSLEHVKGFYETLANDEAFRNQIQGVNSKEECSQIVKAAGYDFTLEEYEEYTAQLLESADDEGELKDLSEKELAAVFGGLTGWGKIQPLYGGVRPWPRPWPQPGPQPSYGVIRPTDIA